MKSLGMVRKIDELGRIVLPIEVRRAMEINPGDGVEIFVEKNRVVLQKYEPSCIFCGEADNNIVFGQRKICSECLAKLKAL